MNRLSVSITVVRQGHWQGKRYICQSDRHPGNVTISENEGGPNTVVRDIKCDRGGWHQLSFPEDVRWRKRPLWLRRLRALFINGINYSTCARCLTSWDRVTSKSVPYGRGGSSCFFLCAACWDQTDVRERLRYGHKSWKKYWYPRRLDDGTAIGQPLGVYEQAIEKASND